MLSYFCQSYYTRWCYHQCSTTLRGLSPGSRCHLVAFLVYSLACLNCQLCQNFFIMTAIIHTYEAHSHRHYCGAVTVLPMAYAQPTWGGWEGLQKSRTHAMRFTARTVKSTRHTFTLCLISSAAEQGLRFCQHGRDPIVVHTVVWVHTVVSFKLQIRTVFICSHPLHHRGTTSEVPVAVLLTMRVVWDT